jgi:sigma-B regulation protein RsbU (phosphoserine phosphatase)
MASRSSWALLVGLLSCAVTYQARYSWDCIQLLQHPQVKVDSPFTLDAATADVSDPSPGAVAAGVVAGDRVLAIGGIEYTGLSVLLRQLAILRPGDRMMVTLDRPGHPTLVVPLASAPPEEHQAFGIAVIGLFSPILCLVLGFGVAARRPGDARAWILLMLMLSFSQLAMVSDVELSAWPSPLRAPAIAWHWVWAFGWPIWMLLFGLHFPERLPLDRRWPWLKWIVIAPLSAQCVLGTLWVVARSESLWLAQRLGPIVKAVSHGQRLWMMLAIGGFFAALGFRQGKATSPDARRRLRLLYFGANLSLIPSLLLFVASIVRGREFDDIPVWLLLPALLALALFPMTLAYVIVVHQAMDVRVVLRQGLKYALARNGILVAQAVVSAVVVLVAISLLLDPAANRPRRLQAVAGGVAFVLLTRRLGGQISAWIDRRFFREAYDAEQILNDLSESVRTIFERDTLLETVTSRVSESLHVRRLAVVIAQDGSLKPVFSHGFEAPPVATFRAGSPLLDRMQLNQQALRVDLHDPDSWLARKASEAERQALRAISAELLLPMVIKNKLLGFVSLGPKRSEEPYSASDLRLLQSVTSQTALALENSRLSEAMAREVAKRERLNRELEIAREVQEGLFPQRAPKIRGLEYAGRCRPALGVGGDYYDFIETPGGGLGVALGDVSGKGIPAALLMAGLQASLRAQPTLAPSGLAALMARLNNLIYETSPPNRYVTFFLGCYDPQTRRLDYVNAGHLAPMVMRGDRVIRIDVGGPVIGLLPVASYEQGLIVLEPGDLIVGFTDGISEAMSTKSEEWGEERMLEAVRSLASLPPERLIEGVIAAADHFAAGAKQYDDMTLVILRVTPEREE